MLKWITSGGGPLLLVEKMLALEWTGVSLEEESNDIDLFSNAKSELLITLDDYERACKVEGYIDIIPIGEKTGLVLGDAPLPTAWFYYPDQSGGLIVRWGYAASEDSIIRRLSELTENDFVAETFSLEIFSEKLIIFDSAFSGEDLDCLGEDVLEVQLSSGKYHIATSIYNPDDETSLIIHRLKQVTINESNLQ